MEFMPSDKLGYLLSVVQELSLCRSMNQIQEIVRKAARVLTGADGATFVLRDGEHCYYVDEDAISPLWKGLRFPMVNCISGWVMLNKRQVSIYDIYKDLRIPADAYRPTFVKSLAMVPIRTKEPIGAIGNYWASEHDVTVEEMKLLQALADSTSIAIENVQMYSDLERKVEERTRELQAFTYAVSHDLKAPLRHMFGFAQYLADDCGSEVSPKAKGYIEKIQASATKMNELIDALLKLSETTRGEVVREKVDLSDLADLILAELRAGDPHRKVEVVIEPGLLVEGDRAMLRAALENLLRNAWKFSRNAEVARIEFGRKQMPDQKPVYFVKDNGAGFDPAFADRLFRVFQRLHSAAEFEGTGIGLTTVQRIISRHGGKVWAESQPGHGARFFFEIAG